MKIFTNPKFISCEDMNRIFSVLIEEQGKIIYVGDNIPEQFKNAETIPLQGQCVVPAFGDTHLHFESFAFFLNGLDCRSISNFDELADRIKTYRASNRSDKIILGFGYSANTVEEKRTPTMQDLDKITSDPIFLVKYDGHTGVGNSTFLKLLSKDIQKAKGFEKQTGTFFQDSFYKAIDSVSKTIPLTRMLNNFIDASDYLAKQGIGFIHTSEGVGFPLDFDVDGLRLVSPALPQDIRIFFQTMNVWKVRLRKLNRIGGCFATALDGCMGSEDAALLSPYSNNINNYGVLFYSNEQVTEFINSAHSAGLQIALHAIGDAAVKQALDCFEIVLGKMPLNKHKHIIIHADLIGQDLIDKASKLQISLALQPPFLYWREEPDSYLSHILGERAKKLLPFKSMLKAGLLIAAGSDAPCTLPNPIFSIYAASNHPNQSESLTVLDALRMHTNWAAKLCIEDYSRGTLTEGKYSDFVVLDKDILNVAPENIPNIRIQDVYFKGNKYTQIDKSPLKLLYHGIIGNIFGKSF